ncbi:hypothetical protein RJ640_006634 [Escallonia rubra]|uniref:Annexin n=1 Tax=Escallonia rubra TaxID=112253 RepID=A0AA88RKN4_9ASTE|nr:hypothetical protein RJ640_006634 [Escallonia rubra]
MSTITVPAQVPSVADDCEQLRKAFSGWGTNEGLIISILAHRNAAQRKHIRETYAETHGEDLLKSLDKELSQDFERIVLLWTLDPSERDALLANEATKRWTSSNQVLVEIACTRSSQELLLARQAYHTRFKKSLEEDVAYHTTGDFRKVKTLRNCVDVDLSKRNLWFYPACILPGEEVSVLIGILLVDILQLLLPLVSSYRYEGDEVNMTLAKSEAKILHQKISEKAYNDDDIIRVLATRSKAQINATLNQYKNEFGNDINKDLKTDPKDEFLAVLRATVKCLTYPEKYFEKVLRLAINKLGTDEGALTRVVATRAEVDMKAIKGEYHKRNSVPLDRAIAKDTNGDYEDMLLALIGHEDA